MCLRCFRQNSHKVVTLSTSTCLRQVEGEMTRQRSSQPPSLQPVLGRNLSICNGNPGCPHICPVLAEVGYRSSRPANPFRQPIFGVWAISSLHRLGSASVDSYICQNRVIR